MIEKFKSLFKKRFTVNLGETYSIIPNYQILESLRRNYIRHGCDFVTIVDEKKLNIVLEVNFMYKVLSRLFIFLSFVVIILIVTWQQGFETGRMIPGFALFLIFVNLIGSAVQVSRFEANFKRTIKLAIKDWESGPGKNSIKSSD